MSDASTQRAAPSAPLLPLQYLKGVGPRRAEVLAGEGIVTIDDLIHYAPRTYIDRASVGTLRDLQNSLMRREYAGMSTREGLHALRSEVSVLCSVESINERRIAKGRTMLLVTVTDGSGVRADLIFWNYAGYYKKALAQDTLYAVSAVPELSKFGRVTFTHPEIEALEEEDSRLYAEGRILPKYTITQAMKNAGITIRSMRNLVEQAMDKGLAEIPETLSSTLRHSLGLDDKQSALKALHFPESRAKLEQALRRMRFEELFFFELSLALQHYSQGMRDTGPCILPPSSRARTLIDSLPFALTGSQKKVINEIVRDMGSGRAMNRLLQGDVGSGKTIVALLCMLMAADNQHQSLLLAPTEILAEQHYQTLRRYCADLDIDVLLVTGSMKKKQRDEVTQRLLQNIPALIVGTHALFSEKKSSKPGLLSLPYHNVGLIVIDEQHRFGVMQRARLRELGIASYSERPAPAPHMLVMSATPIPRTLSMTAYGDLDVSVISERPLGRFPIETRVVFESTLHAQYALMREEMDNGRQCYIVYPLVEQSEKTDLKAATEAFEELSASVFSAYRCAMVHGQMTWNEKEEVMHAFQRHEYDLLITTTVIEVGVDVPNASVMLIQHAERFGLSQLHQLRGRVGRGAHRSMCLLATKDHFAFALRSRDNEHEQRAAAVVRLRTMEQTDDGFRIAEVDLRLRGPGDVLGTRQSGLPNFRFADIMRDAELVSLSRDNAFAIVENDPQLRKTEHKEIRQEYERRRRTADSFATTA